MFDYDRLQLNWTRVGYTVLTVVLSLVYVLALISLLSSDNRMEMASWAYSRIERNQAALADDYSSHPSQHHSPISRTTLRDIFISVKTTRKFHRNRLEVILNTWFRMAPNQVRSSAHCCTPLLFTQLFSAKRACDSERRGD